MKPEAPVTRTRLPLAIAIATISLISNFLLLSIGSGARGVSPLYTLVEIVDHQSGGGGQLTAENDSGPRLILIPGL